MELLLSIVPAGKGDAAPHKLLASMEEKVRKHCCHINSLAENRPAPNIHHYNIAFYLKYGL